MKKRLCLFFCLSLLCGAVFAQSGDTADTSQTAVEGENVPDAQVIDAIQRDIQKIDGNLGSLKNEIASLSSKVESLRAMSQEGQSFLLPAALIILAVLSLLTFGAGIANFVFQKKKMDELAERVDALKNTPRPADARPAPLPQARPAAATARPVAERLAQERSANAAESRASILPRPLNAAESRAPVSAPVTPAAPPARRPETPAPAVTTATPPVRSESPAADPIAELYNSEAKREARRNGYSEDKWMVVDNDVYQRILQGEHIPIRFEEGASRRLAGYVLVDGKHLYPNYHKFNETQSVRADDVLGLVYEINGGPNGFIKRCEPAVMTPSGGSYTLAKKGKIELGRAD